MKTLQILDGIQNILSFFLMFFAIYQLVIWLFAYAKPIKKNKFTRKKHRFMAVISARNEEKVIAGLIQSIKAQKYPKNKIDIYVIADNCTDNTAQIAKAEGAIVYERFNQIKKSKGYALEWFFDIVLDEFPDKYDAFCVFDADNVVSPNFFEKMNDKLCEGEVIVQGYRDIKNVGDNWITANYAIFYWTMNRFYHLARYNLGLSPLINGTGFMVAMSVIKENNGWHTNTLTEDIEFSLKSIARGHKIGWAKDAVVYDEQPVGFGQSCNQRMRWSVGHIQCLKACMPELLNTKRLTAVILDTIIYTMCMPIVILSLIISCIDFIKYFAMPIRQGAMFLTGKFEFGVLFIITTILQAILVVVLEKKDFKKAWKGIITYPIFLSTWFIINVGAFFNTKMAWKQIEHVRDVKIDEIIQK